MTVAKLESICLNNSGLIEAFLDIWKKASTIASPQLLLNIRIKTGWDKAKKKPYPINQFTFF